MGRKGEFRAEFEGRLAPVPGLSIRVRAEPECVHIAVGVGQHHGADCDGVLGAGTASRQI